MNPIFKLVENNLQLFIIVNVIWAILFLLGTYYYMKSKGLIIPKLLKDEIKFKENTASGRSHKSTLSKLGGGNKCVKVIITKSHLYISAIFPFNLIALYWNGIHHIPLEDIREINKIENSVFVNFKSRNGNLQKHELLLKQPDIFIEIIKNSVNKSFERTR